MQDVEPQERALTDERAAEEREPDVRTRVHQLHIAERKQLGAWAFVAEERRVWLGVAWTAFSAASAAALAATGRFLYPNLINEPPSQFKIGLPEDYGLGVDERFKETMGVWVVRTADDVAQHASGFYALLVTCTHLGCTPNYLSAESKFKCPCHGSGFRTSGINFEGPAPRPLERARIVLADDGQILIDKSRKFQFELGQWEDPEAFLKA